MTMEKFAEVFFEVSGAIEAVIGYHYFRRFAGKSGPVSVQLRNLSGKSILRYVSAAMITVTVMQLCFGTVNSVIGVFSPYIIGKDPDITAAAMILFYLLSIFAVCVCYEFLLKDFSHKFSDLLNNIFPVRFLLLPMIMIFSMGMYINHVFYGNIVCESRLEKLSEKAFAMLVFQALGLSVTFCIIRICGETVKNRLETEYARLRAEQAEFRCEKTKAFRHDVKNHITVLTGLLNQGDIQSAEKYLSELKIITDDFSLRFHTGRAVTDVLVGIKLSEAEEKGIDCSCKMKIPRCGIMDSDLCIILANAVDNAVHGCENVKTNSERFVEISGTVHENMFLIEIRNSFDGKGFKNGTGLENIERTAKKYGGSIRISCSEDIFTLQIMMQTFISQH